MCRLIQDKAGRSTFLKDRFFNLMITNFEDTASHKYIVKSLWMARSEMTEHSFRWFSSKNDINNSVNSSWAWQECAPPPFNNSANSSWAWQVRCLMKFQLCMVCRSNFSGIKVQSAYETMYEAFNTLKAGLRYIRTSISAEKTAVFGCLTNALAPPPIALESCWMAQKNRPV